MYSLSPSKLRERRAIGASPSSSVPTRTSKPAEACPENDIRGPMQLSFSTQTFTPPLALAMISKTPLMSAEKEPLLVSM